MKANERWGREIIKTTRDEHGKCSPARQLASLESAEPVTKSFLCVCFVCMCCRVRMERNLRQYHTIRPDSTLDWTVDSLLHGCLPCPMHACMVWYQCVSANVHKCGRRQFFYIILPFASGNICKLHHCLLVHMIQTSFSFSALLQVLHNSRSRSFYDQSQV